jgi:hypothetical protein
LAFVTIEHLAAGIVVAAAFAADVAHMQEKPAEADPGPRLEHFGNEWGTGPSATPCSSTMVATVVSSLAETCADLRRHLVAATRPLLNLDFESGLLTEYLGN